MNVKALSQSLKEKNLRLTHPRRRVYEILVHSGHALSPKEVFDRISEDEAADLVSVYRNLTLFSELGLAHRFQDGRYAICRHEHPDAEVDHHDHDHIHILTNCIHCGRSDEIHTHSKEICSTVRKLKSHANSLAGVQAILLQGVCRKCAKRVSIEP